MVSGEGERGGLEILRVGCISVRGFSNTMKFWNRRRLGLPLFI